MKTSSQSTHPRRHGFVLVLLGLVVLVGAQEIQARHPEADKIAWLREKLPCSNPEEVADLLWGSEPLIEELELAFVVTQELGDGTNATIVHMPGGNGRWAYRPNHHFVPDAAGRCTSYLDAGATTEYLVDQPKLHGRYQLHQTWEGGLSEELPAGMAAALHERRWYFDGEGLRTAFVKTTFFPIDTEDPRATRIEWLDQEGYEGAPASWDYTVEPGDTLDSICDRFEVPCESLRRQSSIDDRDHLRAGQRLRWSR